MKAFVLCQLRLMLLLLVMVNSNRSGTYAIEAVRQRHQQQLRQSIPEVNAKQETRKFGSKILRVPINTTTIEGVQIQSTTHKTLSTIQSNSNKKSNIVSTNRNIQRYDIPVVYKNYTISARNSNAAHVVNNQTPRGTLNYSSRRGSSQMKPTSSSGISARTKANHMKSDRTRVTKPPTTTAAALTTKTTSTTTTTTTTTFTTTSPRTTYVDNFPVANAFNFFNLWNLSSPRYQGTSTKKPPKKYVPPQILDQNSKVEKITNKLPKNGVKTTKFKEVLITPKPNYRTTAAFSTTASPTTSKSPRITTIITTTTTVRSTPKIIKPTTPKEVADNGPFRIALSTLNFSNPFQRRDVIIDDKDKGKRAISNGDLRDRFNCPRESEVRFQLFPKICEIDKDCGLWQKDELCCEIFGAKSCVNGVAKPLEEYLHAPILGLIERKCPSRPLAELWWEVKECQSDMDCWPRVCCPDGRRRYCRTSQPQLETAPVQVKRSFNYLSEYLECTAPPPPIFDLHPKACTSTFDCFPNVCCQEAGLRHCRPPKKSLLTWMANFLNVDFVKRFTQNIVIK